MLLTFHPTNNHSTACVWCCHLIPHPCTAGMRCTARPYWHPLLSSVEDCGARPSILGIFPLIYPSLHYPRVTYWKDECNKSTSWYRIISIRSKVTTDIPSLSCRYITAEKIGSSLIFVIFLSRLTVTDIIYIVLILYIHTSNSYISCTYMWMEWWSDRPLLPLFRGSNNKSSITKQFVKQTYLVIVF